MPTSAIMNSAALPRVALSRPPTVGPARVAKTSVAQPIAAARYTSAAAAAKNVKIAGPPKYSEAAAAGKNTRSTAPYFTP